MNEPDIHNMSGDELHNYLCFLYLKELAKKKPKALELNFDFAFTNQEFQANLPYASYYFALWYDLEKNPQYLKELAEKKENHPFIKTLFLNDKTILQTAFNRIKPVLDAHRPASPSLKGGIIQSLKKSATATKRRTQTIAPDVMTPALSEKPLERAKRTFVDESVKTLYETNIPTIRYQFKDTTEMRLGGPQWHFSKARVSPALEAFYSVIAPLPEPEKETAPETKPAIYFNLLKRQKEWGLLSERNNEARLTHALDALEEKYNIAVITLSADDAFMTKHAVKHTNRTLSIPHTRFLFTQVIKDDVENKRTHLVDFHISQAIRHRLVKSAKDKDSQYIIEMEGLIDKSFQALGINPSDHNTLLSEAQRQAVWFHFNKYELPNYIIQTLNPSTYNFTCKDAIDRGGVSSAYYNLMRCLNSKEPFSKDDFDAILQAAPAMVKGRGMNHHLQLIWNAVDAYVNAHYGELVDNKEHAWLIYWRDMHCPHDRVEHVLIERLEQLKQLTVDKDSNESFQALITELDHNKHASGQRLMLEAVSFTEKMIRGHAVKTDEESFKELIQDMGRHPKNDALKIIAGLLKQLAGYLLYLPTLGYSESLITEGEKTTATGIRGKHELKTKLSAIKIGFFHSRPAQNDTANPEQEKTNTPDKP